MLRYLAQGTRRYGHTPMAVVSRINWEFLAVIEGECAPLIPGQAVASFRSSTLWVFPPESVHGWTGTRKPCRVAIFHFGSVPQALEQRVRKAGPAQHLAVALKAPELERVAALARDLQPHFRRPTTASPLYEQRALLDLSLCVLERAPEALAAPLLTLTSQAQEKVAAALEYFERHLAEQPTVEIVADRLHVSPSYLRRLFWQVRQEGPRSAFARIAMERAKALMSSTTATLAEISAACGFSGPSEFCRAFKGRFKVPPSVWRSGILPPYKPPVRVGSGALIYPQEQHVTVLKLGKYLRGSAK